MSTDYFKTINTQQSPLLVCGVTSLRQTDAARLCALLYEEGRPQITYSHSLFIILPSVFLLSAAAASESVVVALHFYFNTN